MTKQSSSQGSGYAEWDLPDDELVQQGGFQAPRSQFPSITWYSKPVGKPRSGMFFTERTNVEDVPQGWREMPFQLGDNEEETNIVATKALVCCPIGFRQRYSLTNETTGKQTFYPQYQKKAEGDDRRFKSHLQVMVVLPDYPDERYVLGLNGMVKTQSWNGKKGGKGGVMPRLQDFVKKVGEARKRPNLPVLCMWWITLVPETDKSGDPIIIKTQGNSLSAFTLDTDDNPPQYVGLELFERLVALRTESVLAWEKEWDTAPRQDNSLSDEDDGFSSFGGGASNVEEEDEIPF